MASTISQLRAVPDRVDVEHRRLQRLALVRRARHRRRRTGVVAMLVLTLFFGVLFALAAFQAALVQGQSRIEHLDRTVREQQATYDRLRLRVAQLTGPQHIVTRAAALGMIVPDSPTYLRPQGNVVVQVANNGMATSSGARSQRATSAEDWAILKQPERSAP